MKIATAAVVHAADFGVIKTGIYLALVDGTIGPILDM